jgi:uncharacterized protein YbaP (TraB family)
MEADIEEDPAIAQTYMLNFGMDSQHPLAEKLNAKDYAEFVELAAAMKMPEESVAHMRPWLATMLLQNSAIAGGGYQPQYGVDRTLEADAKTIGKPVKTFETPSQQLGFLASLSQPVELAMLEGALRDMHKTGDSDESGGIEQLDAMEAAWLAGDAKKLNALAFKQKDERAPEFFDVMITKRNANWIPQIETMMKTPGIYFIAVGAGHLIGERGLPVLLAKQGYKVARY